MPQPRDILDAPGSLPGEEKPAPSKKRSAFLAVYDVPILAESTFGFTLNAPDWDRVVRYASEDDGLRRLEAMSTLSGDVRVMAWVEIGADVLCIGKVVSLGMFDTLFAVEL